MREIITNLISNAVKFTPINGQINIDVYSQNDELVIKISNSGDKIPENKLQRIFDRFYQVDTAATRQYEGTGIGLALVKELIELHHGTVKVKSTSKETEFTLNLPLKDSAYENEEKVIHIQRQESPNLEIVSEIEIKTEPDIKNNNVKESLEQLEILVVEDNEDIRNYITDILSAHYKVIQAVDGLDGLKKAEEYIPDLIVSDVMMPNMDGYELCSHLKTNEKTNHIPVIILTAKASQQNKLDGLELGADDYLIKPFDEKELIIRIKNLIEIRKKLQKKYLQRSILKPNISKVTSIQQKFIEGIKTIVEENIENSQFSVDDLGEAIAMSRSQVHRKLKALTDQSATKFIRNYRLHRAAELIKLDAGNITEIAYQVGFSSQTYFSSSFQELFHVSPSEYKMNAMK